MAKKPNTHTAGQASGTPSNSNLAVSPAANAMAASGGGLMGGFANPYQAQLNQTLTNLMAGSSGYTLPELQNMANTMYNSYYGQLQLAAQQAHDTNVLALQQQADRLGRTYDQRRRESANQYAQAVSAADRRALSRGMGRSSYNLQTLANLQQAGAEAQEQLWQQQGEDEAHIGQQITQAGQHLAQQIQQYQQGQASDELSWVQQQQMQQNQQNYANQQWLAQFLAGQNQNAVQNNQWMLNYLQNQDQFNQQMGLNWAQYQTGMDQWQQQFNAQHGGQGGGGSSSSSGSSNTTNNTNTNPGTTGPTFASWLAGLGGTGGANSGAGGPQQNVGSTSFAQGAFSPPSAVLRARRYGGRR